MRGRFNVVLFKNPLLPLNNSMNILDKKFLCPAPFTGLTINPQGHIVLCCASWHVPIAHMNNIESLESVYNSSQMQYYRDTFYNI